MTSPSCDVLLATYNGQAFVGEQLDSLLRQTQDDFRVIVRDDGSKDDTLAVVQSYQGRFGGRMVIVGDGVPTGSPTGNFELLMAQSTADHILFCDQDDVWLPERVALCRRLLTEAERVHGADVPIFAFSDLVPVDRNLDRLADSYWSFKKIDPRMANSLSLSLITTPMLGCAAGINRSLLKRATPVHPNAAMHDWWSLHVAILFGKVVWSGEKTVLYRLHGGNASHQKRVSLIDYATSKGPFGRVRHGLRRKAVHARGLLECYGDQMPAKARNLFVDLVDIESKSFFERRRILLKWNLVYPDIQRNVAWFLGV